MQIRGAGGLLVGIALYPVAYNLEIVSRGGDLGNVVERLLWYEGPSRPTNVVLFILLRDALLVGAVVVGALGILGVRGTRVPIALAAVGIAAGSLPWVVYDPYSFRRVPPEWVYENQLWFMVSRWTSVMWILLCGVVFLLAVTDRSPGATTTASEPATPWPPTSPSPTPTPAPPVAPPP